MKILSLLIILLALKYGVSQTSQLIYPQQLCQDDLFKPISICLNEMIQPCPFECPPGTSGGGSWLTNNYTFFLKEASTNPYPISQINSNANTNISIWCTEIQFGALGLYVFELYVRKEGYSPNGSCYDIYGDSTPVYCLDTIHIGSILINVSNQNCQTYTFDICNFIKNPSFEAYSNCPNYNNNSNNVIDWFKAYSSSNTLFLNSNCGNIQISRNTNTTTGATRFPSIANQPFPYGQGIIASGFDITNHPLSHAQNTDLCNNQKYRFSFYTMRGRSLGQVLSGGAYSNIGIYTGNGTFPLAGNFTTTPIGFNKVLEIPITDFTNYFNWHQFSYDFTNIGNTNAFIFQNTQSVTSADLFFDNLSIIPIDTVIFNTQLTGNRCDSAEMILNIPGCYGPYNLDVVVNNDTIHYNQVQDGHTVKIPLAKNNVVKVLSITNSLGCATILNTSDTLIVNNPGDASFTSTDFCEGQTNTITFLGDTGIFSLVNNTTSAKHKPKHRNY